MKEKFSKNNISSIILTISAIMVVGMILLRFTARMMRIIAALFTQLAYGISLIVLIIAVIYLTSRIVKYYVTKNN